MSKENKILTVYIARDERTYKKDDSDHLESYGKLHVFYDTPQWNYDSCKWELARQIGGEIPGYMFPDIKEHECRKFISFANDHQNQLSALCDMYVTMNKMKEENDSKKNEGQNDVQME